MAKNSNEYDRNYYHDVRRHKTVGFKAVAAATCPICGDEWASTQAGYDSCAFRVLHLRRQTVQLGPGEGNGKEEEGSLCARSAVWSP